MRKTRASYFFWGVWVENSCSSDRIVDAVFSKLRFSFQEKNFRGNCFRKYLVAYFYSVFERKHFVLWGKTFSSFLKTAYYVYTSILVVLFSSDSGLWRYQISSKMFLVFVPKISFYQSKKVMEDILFFEKNYVLVNIFKTLGEKGLGCLLDCAVYVSRTIVFKKCFVWDFFSFFSDFEQQIVSLWAIFSQACS